MPDATGTRRRWHVAIFAVLGRIITDDDRGGGVAHPPNVDGGAYAIVDDDAVIAAIAIAARAARFILAMVFGFRF
jgi:hypothetical protein